MISNANLPFASVGIDLLEVARFKRVLTRWPRLANRIFTQQELAFAQTHAEPSRHLAARFCAKEAVVKALALESWSPRQIEVVGGGSRKPRIHLHNLVIRGKVDISLTHTKTTAGAIAVYLEDKVGC